MMETMEQVLIRPARHDDVEALRDVLRAANALYADRAPAGFYVPYLASALDVEGRMASGTVLVAEAGGRLVGTVTYFADANDEGVPTFFAPATAGLRATAVHPDAQGHGIGGSLVDACLDEARRGGATSLALHTAGVMREAIRLYEGRGFRRHPAADFPCSAYFQGSAPYDLTAMAFVRTLD
jgi:GNAT superfamily N-acetyltransferase